MSGVRLIYCAGHGAGAHFLEGQVILQLSCQAEALLFCCDSAALTVHGNLEVAGIMLKRRSLVSR